MQVFLVQIIDTDPSLRPDPCAGKVYTEHSPMGMHTHGKANRIKSKTKTVKVLSNPFSTKPQALGPMSTSTASQQIANPTLDIIPTLSTIPEASSDIESQFDVSTIEGNAEPWLKERVGDTVTFFRGGRIPGVEGPLYCEWMYKRFKVTEVSILHKAEEPRKTEGRVVVEIDVTEGIFGSIWRIVQNLSNRM